MLATLLFVALAAQEKGEADVAAYLHAHRAADRALTAGKTAEARADFEKCLELAPKNATVAYGLACAHAKTGEKDAAFEWLARAVDWGYADAELALWDADLASLREDERFTSAVGAMRNLASGPPSKSLVRTYDKRVKSYPVDVAIDKPAERVAVGYSDGELAVLDAHSGETRARNKNLGAKVWAVAVQPDGKRVAALTYDGKIHFWNPDETKEPTSADALREAETDTGWHFGAFVQFDPTGERLLVAGRDHGASLWTSSGAKLHSFGESFGGFFAVVLTWNSDGSRIAAASESGVCFFDGKTGAQLESRIAAASPVECLDFDGTGKWMATGHADGCARLWDAHTLELLHESKPHDDVWGEVLEVSELRFSPDGARLALTTTTGVYAQVLEAATLKVLCSSGYMEGRMGEPSGICWAADSRRFWTAFVGGAMSIFEIDIANTQSSNPSDVIRDSPRPPWLVRGRVPKASASGIAVFTSYNAVTALDTNTGAVLWTRGNLGRDGTLFQTPGGWFDANFDDLAELTVNSDRNTHEGRPLASLAAQLFDPKRVRAAKAGVVLAPVKW